jgi:flavin reductase (DIM6/NTAB) family NADH-FMN oxidoreductase RutF/rubredoxin
MEFICFDLKINRFIDIILINKSKKIRTGRNMNIEAYFKITYGLYIVCSINGNKRNGYISNTVFQVTAEPAQFAVACNKNNFTADLIKQSNVFSISVLERDPKPETISIFGYKSGKDLEKFANFNYKTGKTGAPILLDDSIAWFECEVVQTFDVGSHLVFVGKVIDGDLIDNSKEPLTYAYYREVKKGKSPKNAPTYMAPKSTGEPKTAKYPEYECPECGYIYEQDKGDSSKGINPGTPFEDLPDKWVCPICGVKKSLFVKKTN